MTSKKRKETPRKRIRDLEEEIRQTNLTLRTLFNEGEEEQLYLLLKTNAVQYKTDHNHGNMLVALAGDTKQVTGHDISDLLCRSTSYFDIIHPQDKKHVSEELKKARIAGEPYSIVYRTISPSGIERWVWDQGIHLITSAGKNIGLQGLIIGIDNLRYNKTILNQPIKEDVLSIYCAIDKLSKPVNAINKLVTQVEKISHMNLDNESLLYFREIAYATRKIKSLFDSLHSYIETIERPISLSKIYMSNFFGWLYLDYMATLNNRDIKWRLEPMPQSITADSLFLARAFKNIIGNTINYGGSILSQISIGHQETSDHHIFYVQDDGEGLEQDKQLTIFDRFTRYCPEKHTGAGLGLPSVNEIAKMHQGNAWAETEKGKGMTVYFTISKGLRPTITNQK